MDQNDLTIIDAAEVRRRLDYPSCIDAMREAMRALSAGTTRQLLRTMIPLGEARTFAQMPGALGTHDMFGAKLVSVFGDLAAPGRRRHRGVIVLFEPDQGKPVAIVDAEEVTHIRTAAATAMATDALAREDASTLLIVGTGGQARTHLEALPQVRPFRRILIWGRDPAKAAALASDYSCIEAQAVEDLPEAVAEADVVCTLTAASQPVLRGEWVRPGTHVNLVGSSGPGPVECDHEMVVRARYIADSRASALDAAAEFLDARAAGLLGDDHIVGEIGEVLLGTVAGRTSADDVTLYKSLGHAVQDLAAAAHLYRSLKT
ncbi:ornithine cyclodeaminase family protein [Pelagerythrobacter rhizovicinus]|uniref:Ornithine cyclodeaminase family protein n=1 Tax=Pelagerythrobacter rhizovicinus TaxID=2268576 RepID=A0A4Q2KMT7_9SPHN|nr:ornithine cyclodeaminase family protein [Pelagerythrobacter rhizovicinus]RXZ65580.1 ornithine cyclodeaminase family protein [Pelagerythrobacter rhizovicinus]